MCKAANIAVVMVVLGGVAAGGAGAAILAGDANAMPGWRGTAHFDTMNLWGFAYWNADVDYAVYAPRQFVKTFGVEPDASHYVYAYQILDFTAPLGMNANATRLSVALDDGVDVAENISFLVGTGDVDPSNSAFTNDAAGWDFNPAIYEPQSSAILYFTSPDVPEMDPATLSGFFATADIQYLPSPDTPEPASLTLLAVGALILARKGRRLRRQA